MLEKLNDIANIQSGVFAKPHPNGDGAYLQVRHFNDSGELDTELLPEIVTAKHADKHLLNEGDIVLAAKGIKNFAAVIPKLEIPTIASTSFLIIKLTNANTSPHFLARWLNTNIDNIKRMARGSAIPSISKSVIMDLEIPVIPVEIQQSIEQIDRLKAREKTILENLQIKRNLYIEQQISNIINKYK